MKRLRRFSLAAAIPLPQRAGRRFARDVYKRQALKSDFILSFCELIMGGKNGLEAVEKTLIDRAVKMCIRDSDYAYAI